MAVGVSISKRKNGSIYYRASITYCGKHISLGSYTREGYANEAYSVAKNILESAIPFKIEEYPNDCILPFSKWVILINFRDHKIYFKNPIYLKQKYFLYYLSPHCILKFEADDLFYYAHHKIQKRGGYLFVADYGMQVNILARYGIKNHAVEGRDYRFINGDNTDFRYNNIEIINRYYGVHKIDKQGFTLYQAQIHINGDYIIGTYPSEEEAAIAYNKAVLILQNKGWYKNYPQNYIEGMDEITYASLYQKIRISNRILNFDYYCQ